MAQPGILTPRYVIQVTPAVNLMVVALNQMERNQPVTLTRILVAVKQAALAVAQFSLPTTIAMVVVLALNYLHQELAPLVMNVKSGTVVQVAIIALMERHALVMVTLVLRTSVPQVLVLIMTIVQALTLIAVAVLVLTATIQTAGTTLAEHMPVVMESLLTQLAKIRSTVIIDAQVHLAPIL
jgi:hypothetical protein